VGRRERRGENGEKKFPNFRTSELPKFASKKTVLKIINPLGPPSDLLRGKKTG
jgi:hypothetical protein